MKLASYTKMEGSALGQNLPFCIYQAAVSHLPAQGSEEVYQPYVNVREHVLLKPARRQNAYLLVTRPETQIRLPRLPDKPSKQNDLHQ